MPPISVQILSQNTNMTQGVLILQHNCICTMPVQAIYRAVQAIYEHIVADNALASSCITIRINEPTNGGIIVSALEVVEAGLLVVDIPTVAQRVDIC